MRYEISEDGTLDTRTNLVWVDTKQILTHSDALARAEQEARETGQAWRVPELDEVLTLIDWTRVSPASSFPGMESGTVWTATLYRGTDDVWYVDTYSGVVGYTYPEESHYVLLVLERIRYPDQSGLEKSHRGVNTQG
jgi:hypothetical protein